MRVRATATNYQGEWHRVWWRMWLWDWDVARPYFLWGAFGFGVKVGVVIGWYIAR